MEPRRYHVLEPIGRGGFATVYRAELLGSDGFRKRVALKVLHPEVQGDAEAAARFRDEARLLGLLQHAGIVKVDGLLRLGDRQVLVEEYVEGADLSTLVRSGPLPVRPALEIAAAAARALDYAHHCRGADGAPLQVLHRDLKPSNLRLSASGDLKVLDFGVARARFPAREDTPAGDLYALGAVLFELLTGDPPLGRSPRAGAPPREPPRALWARLEQRVAAASADGVRPLVQAMLAEAPADRPSAREAWRWIEALAPEVGGPSLYTWAAQAVPAAQSAHKGPVEAEWTGATLSEEISGTATLSAPAARGRGAGAWALAVGAATLLLAAFALGLAYTGSRAAPTQTPLRLAADSAPPPPTTLLTTAPSAPPAPPPTPTLPVAHRARRNPEAPTAQSALVLTGDAPLEIQLESEGQTWAPGPLPAGTYRVLARFSEDDLLRPAGTVVVTGGETRALLCSAERRACR